ncbi:MAG: hypothetical protein HQL69_12275 [Magnetococcales bacterium]|nr:hypothetical protein [Magnetococcales bacterium]
MQPNKRLKHCLSTRVLNRAVAWLMAGAVLSNNTNFKHIAFQKGKLSASVLRPLIFKEREFPPGKPNANGLRIWKTSDRGRRR